MKHDFTSVKNIYIICGKTDMRKEIDGLATLIQDSLNSIPIAIPSSYFLEQAKIVINVCILMEMASPCFIND
ncbi:IS66 family insertion sequence element accessory protein TnpB [Lysinibacillus sp. JNUCC 51]|nr:IS66 family insertion sequence element accessory protein TnpB [Lysinibacillus sp. JNUCC-51]